MTKKKKVTKKKLPVTKKITKKKGKGGTAKPPTQKEQAALDKAKASGTAAESGKQNFMEETRDEDRADAITKGITQAVGTAQTGVKELRTTLTLIGQTTEPSDIHYLLELGRRVAGQVEAVLSEEIDRAKKASKKAGVKW